FVNEGEGDILTVGRRLLAGTGFRTDPRSHAESALCLAHDELPESAGQVTTAVAMGDALLARLRRAGIVFRVADAR
ncbi:saccharopine dehydrogenase, partial [Streptomyces sp. NPDC047014]